MRDKNLLAGIKNVYVVFDKISKNYNTILLANNDEDLIRLYLPRIILEVALRDLSIFKIGVFNIVTGHFRNTTKKSVKLDSYKFPHSRLSPYGENISNEELEKQILETKNKIIAENQDIKEDSNV